MMQGDNAHSCGLDARDGETLQKVASAAAMQDAMAGSCRMLSHGSRLFAVPHGWQSRAVAEGGDVLSCCSMLELEDAMQDENRPVIFIPFDAMMTDADIEKITRRNGVTKTLFREEKPE